MLNLSQMVIVMLLAQNQLASIVTKNAKNVLNQKNVKFVLLTELSLHIVIVHQELSIMV